MRGQLVSLFSLMDIEGTPELNEGALQRYLAEAVWFPTALLPGQGVSWSAIDSDRARASITDSGISTFVEFEFNNRGEIISVYSPARYREVSGHYEATPWKGRFFNYSQNGHYRVPMEAEVEWHLKDRIYPYWKATIKNIRYH